MPKSSWMPSRKSSSRKLNIAYSASAWFSFNASDVRYGGKSVNVLAAMLS